MRIDRENLLHSLFPNAIGKLFKGVEWVAIDRQFPWHNLFGSRGIPMKTDNLKPVDSEDLDDDLLPEYDETTLRNLLKNGVRGKYVDSLSETLHERYRQGTNLVKLDPDIAAAFPTEQAVNEALRKLLNSTAA
jgi:hypothetical protein